MKPYLREFLEQEAVGAARSKEAKRAAKKKIHGRFAAWLIAKAERIEASGNIAGAEAYRDFWRRFPEYARLFPKANTSTKKRTTEKRS